MRPSAIQITRVETASMAWSWVAVGQRRMWRAFFEPMVNMLEMDPSLQAVIKQP